MSITSTFLKKLLAFALLCIISLTLTSATITFAQEEGANDPRANQDSVEDALDAGDETSGEVDLVVPIGGETSFSARSGLGEYINNIYRVAIGVGALIALGIIVFAGIRYITSAGNPAAQADAKGWIFDAIIGLVLLIGAAVLLYTINPRLLNIGGPQETIEQIERESAERRAEVTQAYQEERSNQGQEYYEQQQTTNTVEFFEEKYRLDVSGIGYASNNAAKNAAQQMVFVYEPTRTKNGQTALVAAQEILFERHPVFREDYIKAKGDAIDAGQISEFTQAQFANELSFPSNLNNSDWASEFYRRRKDGTLNEISRNDENAPKLAEKLIEIENRNYLSNDNAHPWIESARAGYLSARADAFSTYDGLVGVYDETKTETNWADADPGEED